VQVSPSCITHPHVYSIVDFDYVEASWFPSDEPAVDGNDSDDDDNRDDSS